MALSSGEPFTLDLTALTQRSTAEAASHFARHGYILLGGVHDSVTRPLRRIVMDSLGANDAEMNDLLAPSTDDWNFPLETRRRLSQVETPPALADDLIGTLRPVLRALLGPWAHVSSSFHAQFKAARAMQHAVDHGGYQKQNDHMELHGAYLLHQDFAGASIPTSPGGLTLWAGMNECPDWPLRLYPGSHRQGLICDHWLANDDPRLASLGEPVHVQACPGTAVLFHAMLVHGSCQPGPRRRASCDIRFFPLCGFLPSQPYFLHDQPLQALADQLETNPPEVIQASLLESQVFLGQPPRPGEVETLSGLNWVHVIQELSRGDEAAAVRHLGQFVNHQISTGTTEDYSRRLLHRAIDGQMLKTLRDRLAVAEPESESLHLLSAFVDRLTATSKEADAANARS